MKYRWLFLSIFLFLGVAANAQTPNPSPLATPANPQTPTSRAPSDVRSRTMQSREVEDAFNQLRMLELMAKEESPSKSDVLDLTREIYRKPSKKELKALSPSPEQLNKYAGFLKQPDTGIIKLNADASCGGEKMQVVVAKESCLPYSMPGGGTAYSFRSESHRAQHLADLILSKNVLKSDGVLQQGIMVNLGDVPLEEMTLQAKGLKYLADFEPLSDAESLAEFDKKLLGGVKADGFVYGLALYAKDQTTYALRSIAYRGKFMRSVKGVPYNEMDFDKRKDLIVVFRIVEQDAGGNPTLLWKILLRKDSPAWKDKQAKGKK